MIDDDEESDEIGVADVAICGWICARVDDAAAGAPLFGEGAAAPSPAPESGKKLSSSSGSAALSGSSSGKKKKKSKDSAGGGAAAPSCFLASADGQALQSVLLAKHKLWCRVVAGSLLFFENDKTTLPLRCVELSDAAEVRVDNEAMEKEMASEQRDLYYESDTPTESAAKVLLQLVTAKGTVLADLLVPAGFGWPDALRAGLAAGSGAAAFANASKLAASERGGTRRWAFRAKKAFAGKLVASAGVKKAATAALPAQTTQVLDAFRVLLAHALKLTPRCKASAKDVERDLLKIVVKWYFFAASNTILIDDVISVDNVLRGAVTQLAFVHGDGTLPAGFEMPADILAARKDDEAKGAALLGKLEGKALQAAIDDITEGLREGIDRVERLLSPHVTPKTLQRLAAVTKVFADRDLISVAATSNDVYEERDQLIKTLEANWLSRDTRSDVMQWQKKGSAAAATSGAD